jgi:hypothetical protein
LAAPPTYAKAREEKLIPPLPIPHSLAPLALTPEQRRFRDHCHDRDLRQPRLHVPRQRQHLF